jgi:hypothetical protein
MKYEEVLPITREEAEASLRGGDLEAICRDLVRAAYFVPDWEWVEGWCLTFTVSKDLELRQIAATCLGHIARVHHKIHAEKVVPVLKAMMEDPTLAGIAADALGDVEQYVHPEEGR